MVNWDPLTIGFLERELRRSHKLDLQLSDLTTGASSLCIGRCIIEMDVADVYQRVSTAWTERRLENVLERQKELAALHKNIKSQSTALITAICQGQSFTPACAVATLQAYDF